MILKSTTFPISAAVLLLMMWCWNHHESLAFSVTTLSSTLTTPRRKSTAADFRLFLAADSSNKESSTSSSSDDQVAALREAAAKAREEAERLSQELGRTTASSSSSSATTKKPTKSTDEIQALIPTLIKETDATQALQGWQDLKDSSQVFGSANLRTFPVSLQMLETRTGLTPAMLGLDDRNVNLDDFKYATLFVTLGSAVLGVLALALLPPNIGATVCYLFALVPIAFLGIGSTAPGLIADAIARIKGGDDDNAAVSKQQRICRHEAAHLCCGYWCGLPVTAYEVKAADEPRVEFGTSGQGQYSATGVAALAVSGLAGLVAEAMEWESAEGAAQDLITVESVFRQAQEFLGAAQQQDLTRWAAMTAALLLKQNADKYEQVVKAIERQAPLEDCVAILEGA